MAIAEGQPRRRNQSNFALEVFGQSIRETNCDCDRSDAPSLLQSIYLRNDAEMHQKLRDKNGWVAQACEALGVPGPAGSQDPRQLAATRRADGLRRQLINRLRQVEKAPEPRREKMLPQVRREYARATKKLQQAGFSAPEFDELIADLSLWKQLEPRRSEGNGQATATVGDLVEEAYLRTLSRYPEKDEREIAITFIEESESKADGVQSLLWALVNTKEFIITH
jgi:hypothetical protein